MKFHNPDTGTFLSAVMLFLHQKIELVEGIGICSVFLLVICKRFAQTYHGNAAFMFERFHLKNMSEMYRSPIGRAPEL